MGMGLTFAVRPDIAQAIMICLVISITPQDATSAWAVAEVSPAAVFAPVDWAI